MKHDSRYLECIFSKNHLSLKSKTSFSIFGTISSTNFEYGTYFFNRNTRLAAKDTIKHTSNT